jgi:hypothetical protein
MSCRLILAIAILLLCPLSGSAPMVAHADGAPMWESPEGLTPGMPNTHVQMTAEDVQVQVQEKGDGVYADVAATFDLLNTGPTTQMLVGFPDNPNTLFPQGAYTPVFFDSARITNFRAWTDTTNYSASEQKVGAGQFAGPWFVWNMVFASTKPLRLQVAYEQPLTTFQDLVPVSYVLTTGALWDGPIGHATVTMTAPNGGGLLPPASVTLPNGVVWPALAPTSADNSQLTWSLSNFKPAQDAEAEFLRPVTWSALQTAEAAAGSANATPDDLASGAQLVLSVFGRDLSGRYGTRYLPLVTSWTQRALAADQSNATAWEAVGDLTNATAPRNISYLRCWPTAMANAYQRAIDLGSASATSKLADLEEQHNPPGSPSLADCPPSPNTTVPQTAPVVPDASSETAPPVPQQGSGGGTAKPLAGSPSEVITCTAGHLLGQGAVSYVCDDGFLYMVNPDFLNVERYSRSPNDSEGVARWPLIDANYPYEHVRWVDDQGHTCALDAGIQASRITCTTGDDEAGQ